MPFSLWSAYSPLPSPQYSFRTLAAIDRQRGKMKCRIAQYKKTDKSATEQEALCLKFENMFAKCWLCKSVSKLSLQICVRIVLDNIICGIYVNK